ncbi:CotH kinase family protein [Granulosicoccus antarcticus]|uniref:Chitinase A1 n=1 Tax=Granulosicoccus antarcticus IMCC3135 TaxID=1192854 RepID=A0A2Z2NW58_9GAMM|nr:CotH kinase family protein [Granulosicoccus antarcticus]ASJ73948.1 Chitinase A1 [Granulosicoccus antarcticus IMCC3135]
MLHFNLYKVLTSRYPRVLTVGLLSLNISSSAFAADPSQPGNFRYQVYSNTAAELFWNRPSDDLIVTSYEIAINGAVVINRDALSYFTDSLVAGTVYEFSVTALDNEGNRSIPATISFIGGDREIPDDDNPEQPPTNNAVPAPGNLQANVYSPSAFEVFWDRVNDAELSYEVSLDGHQITTTNGTSWYIEGLQSAQRHIVDVVALDAAGNQSAVSSVTVKTRDRGPDTVFSPDASDITDLDSYYDQDGYGTVDVVRVDVRTNTVPGVCTIDDQSGCTLADVIADVNPDDEFDAEIAVHIQANDFPNDGSNSNASLRQRGGSSRGWPQKSFRIKLENDDELWRNEDRLQLNKNPFDTSRIRSKLAFDLMREIPNLPSLRTQFVNLWIDDGQGPEDNGLYTHVEYAGKEYLINRDKNKDDNLYKIEFFDFSRSDLKAIQVDENGEPIDKDLFESVLDIKRGDDHRNVVAMVAAINDPEQSFDAILDKYFNKNNVLTWITVNLLLHQTDAITHNFYLYNPVDSEKIYFLPWDYDGTFHPEPVLTNSYANEELQKRLYSGYARGINSDFISRYYRQPGIHEKILAAADELRETYLTDSNISERADRYAQIVGPYLSRSPDVDSTSYDPFRTQDFASSVSGIHDALRNAFDIPMPPTLLNPITRADELVFAWLPAYDVTRRNVLSYELQISTSLGFEADNIVVNIEGIPDATEIVEYALDISALPSGKLYYRVTARGDTDPQGVWQIATNTLNLNGTTWYGVLEFETP